MAKSPHPQYMTLRILASKLERSLLTSEEVKTIASILRSIADGEDPNLFFGGRPAHRPNQYKTYYYVEQIIGLIEPTFNGKPGIKVSQAISQVAMAAHVSDDHVRSAYYSRIGRSYAKSIRKAKAGPFQDP